MQDPLLSILSRKPRIFIEVETCDFSTVKGSLIGPFGKVFIETPEKFDPRDYLSPAREALTVLVALKMRDLGTAGHAAEVNPVTLDDMKSYDQTKKM